MLRRASITALTLVGVAVFALPAHAAESVENYEQLQASALSCPGDGIATLSADIAEPDEVLLVDCDITIDLAGFQLQLLRIKILDGNHLTVTGSPDSELLVTGAELSRAGIETSGAELTIHGEVFVVAFAGSNAAGIGGGVFDDGGIITIKGNAEVFTTGWNGGAGIGGGTNGDGGTITITGSANVTATGTDAAGIGGGYEGHSGTIMIGDAAHVVAYGGNGGAGLGAGRFRSAQTISIGGNAVVTATGGDLAAGIGGGYLGNGGDVTIATDATVTALGGHTAVGAGFEGSTFGSLSVAGALRVPAGALELVDADADIEITPTGRLLGVVGNETTGALISGHDSSAIVNNGVIALDTALVGVTVAENNYWVSFDTQGGTDPDPVRVFGPAFDVSYRALPSAPTDTAWNTAADGTGEWFTAGSTLDADLTLYAAPVSSPTITAEVTAAAIVGTAFTFAPTVTGSPAPTITTTSTLPVGLTLDSSTGVISGEPVDTVGDYPVTLTATNTLGVENHDLLITLDAGVVSALSISATSLTANRGDTITITASGADEANNPLGDVTDDITLSSDVDTDIVEGNTVTFVDASPHTITVVHSPTGSSASVVINVTASSGLGGLPSTGALVVSVLAPVAALLIAAGTFVIATRRRREGAIPAL